MMFGLVLSAALALWGQGAIAARVPTLTGHVPNAVARGSALRIGMPSPQQTMELSIELPSRNEAELRTLLGAIYDPASPFFRHYLTVAQFTARYGPVAAHYDALVRFALVHNLRPHALAANRRVLDVQGSVADVERAFDVRIGLYRNLAEQRTFFAPDREPTLEGGLRVLHIAGLDDDDVAVSHLVRGSQADMLGKSATGSGPKGNFIASDVRAAYYGGTALDGSGQSLGLFEYAGYNLADVRLYFSRVGQKNSVPIVGESVNGAKLRCTGKCDDSEQVLDIEEAASMAPGLSQVVVYVGHNDVSIINQMAADGTSKQLSCSWGWRPDPKQLDPIFEELAAQGQSFLVATGDDGYRLAKGAVWPADDQYVTAVGGTDLTTQGPGGPWQRERGWHRSGGGPSPDGIPIPSYQVPFITSQNGGSTTLRNVPDIAGDADTDNFSCFDGRCVTGSGGTSYAAPLWAGFIALANEYGATAGQPPLGFLNPAVYAIGGASNYGQAFHDETKGFNGAYTAVPGFDLVTGFGSPTGDALIEALEAGS
jgi:subtilase family serine protease